MITMKLQVADSYQSAYPRGMKRLASGVTMGQEVGCWIAAGKQPTKALGARERRRVAFELGFEG